MNIPASLSNKGKRERRFFTSKNEAEVFAEKLRLRSKFPAETFDQLVARITPEAIAGDSYDTSQPKIKPTEADLNRIMRLGEALSEEERHGVTHLEFDQIKVVATCNEWYVAQSRENPESHAAIRFRFVPTECQKASLSNSKVSFEDLLGCGRPKPCKIRYEVHLLRPRNCEFIDLDKGGRQESLFFCKEDREPVGGIRIALAYLLPERPELQYAAVMALINKDTQLGQQLAAEPIETFDGLFPGPPYPKPEEEDNNWAERLLPAAKDREEFLKLHNKWLCQLIRRRRHDHLKNCCIAAKNADLRLKLWKPTSIHEELIDMDELKRSMEGANTRSLKEENDLHSKGEALEMTDIREHLPKLIKTEKGSLASSLGCQLVVLNAIHRAALKHGPIPTVSQVRAMTDKWDSSRLRSELKTLGFSWLPRQGSQ